MINLTAASSSPPWHRFSLLKANHFATHYAIRFSELEYTSCHFVQDTEDCLHWPSSKELVIALSIGKLTEEGLDVVEVVVSPMLDQATKDGCCWDNG